MDSKEKSITKNTTEKLFHCKYCNNAVIYSEAIQNKYKYNNSTLTSYNCPICKRKSSLVLIKEPGSIWYFGGKTKVKVIKSISKKLIQIEVVDGNHKYKKGKVMDVKICTLQIHNRF